MGQKKAEWNAVDAENERKRNKHETTSKTFIKNNFPVQFFLSCCDSFWLGDFFLFGVFNQTHNFVLFFNQWKWNRTEKARATKSREKLISINWDDRSFSPVWIAHFPQWHTHPYQPRTHLRYAMPTILVVWKVFVSPVAYLLDTGGRTRTLITWNKQTKWKPGNEFVWDRPTMQSYNYHNFWMFIKWPERQIDDIENFSVPCFFRSIFNFCFSSDWLAHNDFI